MGAFAPYWFPTKIILIDGPANNCNDPAEYAQFKPLMHFENGGAKVGHGTGRVSLLWAR